MLILLFVIKHTLHEQIYLVIKSFFFNYKCNEVILNSGDGSGWSAQLELFLLAGVLHVQVDLFNYLSFFLVCTIQEGLLNCKSRNVIGTTTRIDACTFCPLTFIILNVHLFSLFSVKPHGLQKKKRMRRESVIRTGHVIPITTSNILQLESNVMARKHKRQILSENN